MDKKEELNAPENIIVKNPYELYARYFETLAINEKSILFQSYGSGNFAGNPYYILKEIIMSPISAGYTFYIAVNENNITGTQKLLSKLDTNSAVIVPIGSDAYLRALASVKYLVNDTYFPQYFIKKNGQFYIHTGHGTPMKHIGRDYASHPFGLSSMQRNLISSDMIMCTNKFTLTVMRKAYMLDNLYQGKYVVCGAPKNSVFFDEASRKSIREELQLDGKKVFAYMPTWRGMRESASQKKQILYTIHALREIDKKMNDDTVMFVNWHSRTTDVTQFSEFKHILPFPDEYEAYAMLSACDCLITDYSNILFDWANTGRKAILFAYDINEYEKERGFYFKYESLPFPIVKTPNELFKEMTSDEPFDDYTHFKKSFCMFDCPQASQQVCDMMLRSQPSGKMFITDSSKFANGKENVLLLAPRTRSKNAFENFEAICEELENDSERNYFIAFEKKEANENREIFDKLTQKMNYIPVSGEKVVDKLENKPMEFFAQKGISSFLLKKAARSAYERETKRAFPKTRFSRIINFDAADFEPLARTLTSDAEKTLVVAETPAPKKDDRAVFALLEKAVRTFDSIIVNDEKVKKALTETFNKIDESKIIYVPKFVSSRKLKRCANAEISYPPERGDINCTQLEELLDSDNYVICAFNNKGAEEIKDAVRKLNNKGVFLVLIGGKRNERGSENIIVIQDTSCAYAIMKRSDIFVFPEKQSVADANITNALLAEMKIAVNADEPLKSFLEKGYAKVIGDDLDAELSQLIQDGFEISRTFKASMMNSEAIKRFITIFQ